MKCPSFKTLVDYWEEVLPQKQGEKVRAHLLEGCKRCAQSLEFLEEVLGERREFPFKQPPKSLVQKAQTAFERGRGSSLVRRLVAKLILDSRQSPGYAEIRTGGIKPVYLSYRVQGVDVDLIIQSGNSVERRSILGQVSLERGDIADLQSAEVRVIRGQDVVRTTRTDLWGEFTLTDLTPGEYSLKLDLGRREVEVRDLWVEEGF